jgi:hypothetical protein
MNCYGEAIFSQTVVGGPSRGGDFRTKSEIGRRRDREMQK